MLPPKELRHAVELQQKSYQLLKWVENAIRGGFIDFQSAHDFTHLEQAAFAWMAERYDNLPDAAKPARPHLEDYAAFFSTYLENSFTLNENPGKHLYSPDAHCFCPMCSWLVDAPNLVTKKITNTDRKRAFRLKVRALNWLQPESQIAHHWVKAHEQDHKGKEDICLFTYGLDLLDRIKGIARGPSVLFLWRGFAWTPQGSPKKKFTLSAELILQAQTRLLEVTP